MGAPKTRILIGMQSKGQAHEDSDGNEDSTENLTRSHSCYLLAKNLSTFWPCPETLCKAEFKGDELTNLAEKISRHHNIQVVAQILLAVLARLTVRIRSKKQ